MNLFLIFFVFYAILISLFGVFLFKNLKNNKEKLKFIIPVFIAILIGAWTYLSSSNFPYQYPWW